VQKPSRPFPFISSFENIGQTCPACWKGDRVTGVANERGEGRGFEKATPAHAVHIPNSRPNLELLTDLPFTRAVLPENPKTRGFVRVCGSRAERVGSLSLSLSFPRNTFIYLRIQPPSKPNFSLTKLFLSG